MSTSEGESSEGGPENISNTGSGNNADGGEGGAGGGGGQDGVYPGNNADGREGGAGGGGGVWLAEILENIALQSAILASRRLNRCAAARYFVRMFEVHSTWNAISRIEELWYNLCQHIWNSTDHRIRETWREEFIFLHSAAARFRDNRYVPSYISIDTTNNNNHRRIALSDHHIAAGFMDGSVHVFSIPDQLHVGTYFAEYRDVNGQYSSSISGIILLDDRLIFASLDGSIYICMLNPVMPLRCVHVGDYDRDGVLVDFTGNNRWWVGLYTGVVNRSLQFWDAETEGCVFVGHDLTDTSTITMRTLLRYSSGRICLMENDMGFACTADRLISFTMQDHTIVYMDPVLLISDVSFTTFDIFRQSMLIGNISGLFRVRRVPLMERVCVFALPMNAQVHGSLNSAYAIVWEGQGNTIRIISSNNGLHVTGFQSGVSRCLCLIANDRYIAICTYSGIRIWDFGTP